jgi:hypothetical protein
VSGINGHEIYNEQASKLNLTSGLLGMHCIGRRRACSNFDKQVRLLITINTGCMSNDNSTYSTSGSITTNQTTSVSSVMKSTGTLKFTNISSNPFRIYLNGVVVGDQPGNTGLTPKVQAPTVDLSTKFRYCLYPRWDMISE